jgi:hypothetical protein
MHIRSCLGSFDFISIGEQFGFRRLVEFDVMGLRGAAVVAEFSRTWIFGPTMITGPGKFYVAYCFPSHNATPSVSCKKNSAGLNHLMWLA